LGLGREATGVRVRAGRVVVGSGDGTVLPPSAEWTRRIATVAASRKPAGAP
jgi:hypothetical protein